MDPQGRGQGQTGTKYRRAHPLCCGAHTAGWVQIFGGVSLEFSNEICEQCMGWAIGLPEDFFINKGIVLYRYIQSLLVTLKVNILSSLAFMNKLHSKEQLIHKVNLFRISIEMLFLCQLPYILLVIFRLEIFLTEIETVLL